VLTGSEVRCAEFLDQNALRKLATAHRDGEDLSNGQLLIGILVLELWLTSYLPRALAPPPRAPEPVSVVV
jgi:hypothetical protein